MSKEKEATPQLSEAEIKIQDLQAENDKLRAEIEALKASANDGLPRVRGSFELEIEHPVTGAKKVSYTIAPGFPKVRIARGEYAAQDVCDAAQGKKQLPGLTQARLLQELTKLAGKQVAWLSLTSAKTE